MALARLCREKPKAVLCIGCDAGPTVSLMADYFDLPGVEYHVAVGVKNKGLMREKLNFEHPKYHFIKSSWDIRIADWLEYDLSGGIKFLVKPLNQSGSKGIKLISSYTELEYIDYNEYVLEEYCEGVDLFPEIEQF